MAGNNEDLDVKEYVLFHLQRNITSLFKRYIVTTEDLLREHRAMLKKVEKQTSKDFVENIDYFDEDKYIYLRKKILDSGNETLRDLERHMDMITIELNLEKIKNMKKEQRERLQGTLTKVMSHTKKLKKPPPKTTKVKKSPLKKTWLVKSP